MTSPSIDLTVGGVTAASAILRLPRWPEWVTPEVRVELIEEEAILRDDLVAYGYAYAAMELDALMEHFSDDVVIVNPGGTFTGKDVVRRNYEYLFSSWPSARHIWANVAVRFIARDEAYRTSFIYEAHPAKDWWGMSTDLHRLRKIDGRWKIVERSMLGEGSFALHASEAPLEDRRARQELLEEARNGC